MKQSENPGAVGEWLGTLSHEELRELILAAAQTLPGLWDWLDGQRALEADDPAELLGVVNATLAPSKRFYYYRDAMEYAATAQNTVALLTERAHAGSAGLLKVLERAITLVTRATLRSDDSAGMHAMMVRELLDSHARAACTANPPLTQSEQTRLVKWLVKYRYGGTQDFFDPDIVAYAPALSARSIDRYREAIQALDLGTYGRYPLTRLAVLDRDKDAIIAAHGEGRSNALVAARVVADLDEAGLREDAVEYARAHLPDEGGFSFKLGDFLVQDALDRGDGEAAVAFRRQRFDKQPLSTAFDRLRETATTAGLWDRERTSAEERLAEGDLPAYIRYLLKEGRAGEAWRLASERIDPGDDVQTWLALCEQRAQTHPADTLPIYQGAIRRVLETTDKRNYKWAADLLKDMRAAAQAAGAEAEFAEFLAAVREENRRRPTCIKVLDRAGL